MKPGNPLFKVFGRSPIRPLQKHMAKAYTAANTLIPFFEAVLAGNWEKALELQQQIDRMETQADHLKKELRLNLPKGLFLPIPRTDILELLSRQDRLANQAEDVAGLVIGRKMVIPEILRTKFMTFLHRCIDAASQAHKAINELDELLETGFRGNEIKIIEEMIVELDKIERDTDMLQIEIRQELYNIEETLPPVQVIFLYKVLEWTGDLADEAQSIGEQLHLILSR